MCMKTGEIIDRYGIRLLVLIVAWLAVGRLGTEGADRVLSAVGIALCAAGALDALAPPARKSEKRAPARPKLRAFAAAALTRRNAGRFMAAALFLFGIGLVFPSPYFLVVAGANVVLAFLCLVVKRV